MEGWIDGSWMDSDGRMDSDGWISRWMGGRVDGWLDVAGKTRRGGKSRTDEWMVGPLGRLPWCCDSGPPSSQEVGWDGPQMIHFGPEYVFEALSLSPSPQSLYLFIHVFVHLKFESESRLGRLKTGHARTQRAGTCSRRGGGQAGPGPERAGGGQADSAGELPWQRSLKGRAVPDSRRAYWSPAAAAVAMC